MIIKVLGPGCANCQILAKNTEEAVRELGVDATIIKVTDYTEILGFGIMSTPALVINGNVAMAGRVPSKGQIVDIIGKAKTE